MWTGIGRYPGMHRKVGHSLDWELFQEACARIFQIWKFELTSPLIDLTEPDKALGAAAQSAIEVMKKLRSRLQSLHGQI